MEDEEFWIIICKEIGSIVYSKIKEITESERNKIVGKGIGGDRTLLADIKIEDIIFEAFKKDCKNFAFISEECGKKVVGKNEEVTIMVDPLDGSNNFRLKIPLYSTSIAIGDENSMGSIKVAYIVNLINGDYYYAIKDKGVYKNDKKIHVKKGDNRFINLEFTKPYAERVVELSKNFHTRKLGCVSLSLCTVAEGTIDSCIVAGSRTLDICAPQLIVKEAGGIITDQNGNDIKNMRVTLKTQFDLVASTNKEIHSRVLSLYK